MILLSYSVVIFFALAKVLRPIKVSSNYDPPLGIKLFFALFVAFLLVCFGIVSFDIARRILQ